VRVAIDATPLLGPRTGIGTYTANLLDRLASAADVDLVATAFTARGAGALAAHLPTGVPVRARPVPARVLRAAWLAGTGPSVELLTGPVEVFHGTNFVVPPLRHASGVVTIHDLGYLRNPATVTSDSLAYRRLVPLALARGAHVCTPSRAVAHQVSDAYAIAPERIHVTPLGVDPAWAAAGAPGPELRATLGLPQDYLVAVGTLEPRKNLALLVEAYRLALQRGTELPPLVLVGARGWGAALDTSALPDGRIRRTGHLPLEQLRQVVAGAVALLFPSIDEGFGLPPLEALACGTPVVCADLEVTREVLGDQASYADPRSVGAFLSAVEASLGQPVGTPATRRAHATAFTWQACAEATLTAYRDAASDR